MMRFDAEFVGKGIIMLFMTWLVVGGAAFLGGLRWLRGRALRLERIGAELTVQNALIVDELEALFWDGPKTPVVDELAEAAPSELDAGESQWELASCAATRV
ncbi:MAG: hypothetical protein AAFQ82_01000 [Myxococcota bacterium]